jgi:hypothetical protein
MRIELIVGELSGLYATDRSRNITSQIYGTGLAAQEPVQWELFKVDCG